MLRGLGKSKTIPFVLVLIVVSILVLSCSFSIRPQTLTFSLSHRNASRLGRDLSDLDHFALVITEGLPNTISSNDVGGKSLGCLFLNGLVTFPLTLAQLVSGINLSIPTGTYRFSVIGFDSSGVVNPSSIAELYLNSPTLKEYVVAQATLSTLQSNKVNLSPTFATGVTPDQLGLCPVTTTVLHGLLTSTTKVFYLKGIRSQWSTSPVSGLDNASQGSLALAADGTAHVSYGEPDGVSGLQYATNKTGTFASQQVTNSTGGKNYSAIAIDSVNDIQVVSNEAANLFNLVGFTNHNTLWNNGSPIQTGLGVHVQQLDLVAGANRTLFLMSKITTPGAGLDLFLKNSSLNWTSAQVATAEPTPCTGGIFEPSGVYDAEGFAHAVYRCKPGGPFDYIGYATNRSGMWLTSKVYELAGRFTIPRLAIDGAGGMHAVYRNSANELWYQYRAQFTGNWSTPIVILSELAIITDGVEIAAPSANDVHVIVLRNQSGVGHLTYLTNRSGSWVPTYPAGDYSADARILNGFFAR